MKHMFFLVILAALILTGCNQPYQPEASVALAAPAKPESQAEFEDSMFPPAGTIPVKLCADASVYTSPAVGQVLYVIPRDTEFKAYALSASWVTVYPDWQNGPYATQPQYIQTSAVCQ